jgi:hypothetical protein
VAYQFFRFNSDNSKTFREYNIDFSVGRGGQNRTEDAMLVQALLRILYIENTDAKFAASMPPLPDKPDIVVDGLVGPTTNRYIMHFKNQARQKGLKMHPDEIMDPFRANEPDSISTISKTRYAFGALMNVAAKADAASGLNKFANLPEHDETKEPLKSALKQSRGNALQYGG